MHLACPFYIQNPAAGFKGEMSVLMVVVGSVGSEPAGTTAAALVNVHRL